MPLPVQNSMDEIPEGQLTSRVYGHIRDGDYDDAIQILRFQLQMYPNSHAATSLLAYCYYYVGNFEDSTLLYQQLCKRFPDSVRYAMALANSRFKAYKPEEALQLKLETHDADVMRAYCKHDLDDTSALNNLVDKLTREPTDDHRVFCLKGNLLAKKEQFYAAIEQYNAANEISADPRIFFAKAVAHYRENNYPQCLKTLGDLVDLSAKKYPELVQAAQTFNSQTNTADDTQPSPVYNANALLSSSLIEAFNLKAAIEWNLGDEYAANRALNSMPYRKEEDLDPVTLHNKALSELQHEPNKGVKKLQFLIQYPPFPVEAFQNLINIYIQHELFDLAADLLAENMFLAKNSLEPEKLEYYQAVVQSIAAPETAYALLEKLKSKYAIQLRRIRAEITSSRNKGTKKQQENHGRFNTNEVKNMSTEDIKINTLLQQYEQKLSIFIPVVTWYCSILYQIQRYKGCYKVLTQYEDLLEEHPSYKLNQANILFSNEEYPSALEKYYQVVEYLGQESILDVPAIAVANLCTCQVMTGQNNLAETIMQKVDKAQQDFLRESPECAAQLLHLSIINIILGTLYSINDNQSFGLRRIIAAMDPIQEKLSADSWMYVKRPLLSLAETASLGFKGPMEEYLIDVVIVFLDDVIKNGAEMPTIAAQVSFEVGHTKSVAEEARELKSLFLQLL